MSDSTVETGKFLVCGIGLLGQYCVAILKEFGVSVNTLDIKAISSWQIPAVANLIDRQFIGDCCQPSVLEHAQIEQYRAILFVTSDERVNIEAAFAARSLNPNVRLIVRSAQDNLNEVLSDQLGNFVAFEATQLPAPSFALAALATETRGFFALEEHFFRVVRIPIDAQHPWYDRRMLHELNTSTRRLLTHTRDTVAPQAFYQWEPTAIVQAGDEIVYIEVADQVADRAVQEPKPKPRFSIAQLKQMSIDLWYEGTQTQRVVIVSLAVMFVLLIIAVISYHLYDPTLTLQEVINIALVLLIGGFDNFFGQFHLTTSVPWLLYFFSFALTIAGTIFTGIVYAALTERILVSRFQFTRRQPIPTSNHVVIVGLGRVGHRVSELLQDLKQPFVGIHETMPEPLLPPQVPLIVDSYKSALGKVNLATAKSVLAVTDDEVLNLEVALRAQAINPATNLIIRTFKPSFQQNIAKLLPKARVLSAYALAAEAFAAAAFGENILSLFRLNNQTLLVTEYTIEPTDHLNGRLLSEVSYGYEVVPILHRRATQTAIALMPSEDLRLQIDDRLVILASIQGIKRIERGELQPRPSRIRVEKAISSDAAFEGAATIARVTGCDISTARSLMGDLPAVLGFALYDHQAQRLIRELGKMQVIARLV